jgi:hypothetical protein
MRSQEVSEGYSRSFSGSAQASVLTSRCYRAGLFDPELSIKDIEYDSWSISWRGRYLVSWGSGYVVHSNSETIPVFIVDKLNSQLDSVLCNKPRFTSLSGVEVGIHLGYSVLKLHNAPASINTTWLTMRTIWTGFGAVKERHRNTWSQTLPFNPRTTLSSHFQVLW